MNYRLKIFLWILCFAFWLENSQAKQITEAAFSPSPKAVELVIDTINSAEHSIELSAYTFTNEKVANALVLAQKRGVEVRIVLDKRQAKRHYQALETLRNAKVPIRINSDYNIMHDKYIIIDNKTVETGSFNYTTNAEKHNAENVIVIKGNKKLAKQYLDNWQKLWDQSN